MNAAERDCFPECKRELKMPHYSDEWCHLPFLVLVDESGDGKEESLSGKEKLEYLLGMTSMVATDDSTAAEQEYPILLCWHSEWKDGFHWLVQELK